MPCGCNKKTVVESDTTSPQIIVPKQLESYTVGGLKPEEWREDVRHTIRLINKEIADAKLRGIKIRAVRSHHPSRGRVAVSYVREDGVKKVFATAIRKKWTPIVGSRTIPNRGKQA